MFEGLMQRSVEGGGSPVPVPWLVWRDGLPHGKRVRATDPMAALGAAGFDLDEVTELDPLVGERDFAAILRGQRIRILRVR